MKKILLADHDEVSLLYYCHVFKYFHVSMVTNLSKAIKKFQEEKPHLVILNDYLVESDGFDLVKEIRTINKNVEIIMISCDKKAKEKAFLAGCNKFFLKPISPAKLLAIVEGRKDP